HCYLRHRCAVVPRHGHISIAARVKRAMAKVKQPPDEPMTLGNMRRLGVQRLIAYCLNPSCQHEGLIDVSKFADDVDVTSWTQKSVCAKCRSCGPELDGRLNWKGQPLQCLTGKVRR